MRRYRNRPMSLADACLVRLSEIHGAAEVLTLDGPSGTIGGMGTR
jgi:predicted nucleic acid-binding protein